MSVTPPDVLALSLGPGDWWTMAVAVACSIACGVAGCYLVLRRMSLLGDAISHAVLPGLGVAFMLTGSRDPGAMLLGAAAAGGATAGLSALLARVGKIADDAALGVVFTLMFAAGVIVLALLPADLHLDASCVLYGNLEFVALDTRSVWGMEVPRVLIPLGLALAVVLGTVVAGFKELRIVAFDPGLARSLGVPAGAIHAAMLGLVAGVTVVAFEAVGSVLVVAMLIAPGATARLLTNRLGAMYAIAGALAASAAAAGYLLAAWRDVTVAGMVSVVAGAQFILAALAAPRHGMVARWLQRLRLSAGIAREDVLGMLFRWHERTESGAGAASDASPAGPARPLAISDLTRAIPPAHITRWAIWSLRRGGLVERRGGGLELTPAGRQAAARLVGTHRLWEAYLAQHLGLPLDHVHDPSHRAEHFIGDALKREVQAEVGNPTTDPHGRVIP